ncbi:MAG TPA: sensor histidine kinase [Candidatus Acidoferrales bacterium]|nr:sensor histidine kinase [Candidatus Acidoferrales bacterium]
MPSVSSDKRWLEQLVNVARPVALLLALLALREGAPSAMSRWALIYLVAYMGAAVIVAASERIPRMQRIPLPPEIDAVVLAVFLPLTPSLEAFWFFYLFTGFALAAQIRKSGIAGRQDIETRPRRLFTNDGAWLSAGATAAVLVRQVWLAPAGSPLVLRWFGLAVGTYFSGLAMAWLGMRERGRVHEDRFIESLVAMLRVEKGLSESVRLALSELAREFECEQACLVICDEEIDRMFVWKGDQDRRHVISPETLPLSKAGTYLAEDLTHDVCWNSFEGAGAAFGWHRDTGTRARASAIEVPPASTAQELQARAAMAVTLIASNHPTGRVLLVNPRRAFSPRDLRWLERVVRHLNSPLENVFLLRSFRARAVEAERSRISRDLHDGILQTLLSLNIQIGVLRRKLPSTADHFGDDLAMMEKTLREQGEELRQMVKDLRPLRVESADLREMMYSFAERYHTESGMAVDLFLAENDLRAPDRICREVFQIYRESLNNIKKHARASHVVVKLWQDDSKVFLVVDDNGQGFSFGGRFTSEELDRLRLGPISIKERTRSVGGVLTVESNPGHGARLTIEIPLN